MSSPAQILANQANAQHSTGPVTEEGKARVAANRITHGLTSSDFRLLPWESVDQYVEYATSTKAEYNPQTREEERLVDGIIQHYWLMQRALTLQHPFLLKGSVLNPAEQKTLGLYMRYQSTNERAYFKALRELRTIRKQKTAEQNGFESQKRQQAAHEAKTRLANAKAEALEVETECKKMMEAVVPGATKIDLEELAKACADAIAKVAQENQPQTAA